MNYFKSLLILLSISLATQVDAQVYCHQLFFQGHTEAEVQSLIKEKRFQEAAWTMREKGYTHDAIDLILKLETEMQTSPITGTRLFKNRNMTETYFVTLQSGISAIFKPHPDFWNLKKDKSYASNYLAEIDAYQMDRKLGLFIVPITVEREVDGKLGSLQLFVPGESTVENSELLAPAKAYARMRLLDYLINNQDRNANNFLISGKHLIAIDHGHSFVDSILPKSKVKVSQQEILNEKINLLDIWPQLKDPNFKLWLVEKLRKRHSPQVISQILDRIDQLPN